MASTLRARLGLETKQFSSAWDKVKSDTKAGVDAAKADIEKLSKSLAGTFDGAKKEAADYADQLKKSAAAMIVDGKKGSAAWDAQKKELKAAAAEAKKYEDALKEVEAELGNAEKAGNGLATSLVNAASAGVVFQGIGEAISGFAEKGVEARNAIRELTAQTGATGEELQKLVGISEDVFRRGVGDSVAEATKAIGTAKQLLGGFLDDAGLQDITVAAGGIAKAFDKDVNEVLGKSRTLIANFGLSGKEAGDLLSLAMQEGGTAMDDVLDTMDEYSQLAKQAGFSAEDFTGRLLEGVKAGTRDTDKLADALKEAQIRLKAGDITKTLGEISAPVARTIEGIVAAGEQGLLSTKEVLQRTTALTEEAFDSGAISESIRTQLQVAVAGTPAEDIGSDVYARVFGAEIDVSQIQAKAAEAGQQITAAIEPQGFFEKVQRGFEVMQTKAAEAFAPVLAGAGEVLTTVGQIGPGLALAADKFSDFGGASGIMEKVRNRTKGVGNAASGLGGSFKGSIGSMLKIAGPLALVGLLVGVLVKAYETNEGFKKSVDGLLQTFQEVGQEIVAALQPAIEALVTNLRPIIASIGETFGNLAKRLAPILGRILTLLGGLLSTVVEIGGNLISALLPAFEAIIGVGATLLEIIVNLASTLIEALAPILSVVAETVGKLAGALANSLGAILVALTPLITLLADGLAFLIGLLAEGLLKTTEFLVPILETLATVLGDILVVAATLLAEAVQFLVGLLEGAISIAVDVGKAIGDFLVKGFNNTVAVVNDVVSAIEDFIGWIGDAASSIVDFAENIPIIGDVVGFLGDAADFVGDTVSDAIDGIGSFFGSTSDKVVAAAQKTEAAGRKSAGGIAQAFGAATTKITGHTAAAEAAAQRLINKLLEALGFANLLGSGDGDPEIPEVIRTPPPPDPERSGGGTQDDPFKKALEELDKEIEKKATKIAEDYAELYRTVIDDASLSAEQKKQRITLLEEAEKEKVLQLEREKADERLRIARDFEKQNNAEAKKALNGFLKDVADSGRKYDEFIFDSLEKAEKLREETGKSIAEILKARREFQAFIDDVRADIASKEEVLSVRLGGIDKLREDLADPVPGAKIVVEGVDLRKALSEVPKAIGEDDDEALKSARVALADKIFDFSKEVPERLEELRRAIAAGIVTTGEAARLRLVLDRDGLDAELAKIPAEVTDNPRLKEARKTLADALFSIDEESAERVKRIDKAVEDGIISEERGAQERIAVERAATARRLEAVQAFYGEVEKLRRADVEAEYDAEQAKFSLRRVFVDATKKLLEAFGAFRDQERDEDLAAERAKLEDEADALTASLAKREISFKEYNDRIRELREQQAEAAAEAGEAEGQTFGEKLRAGAEEALKGFAGQQTDELRATLDRRSELREQYERDFQIKRLQLIEDGETAEDAATKARQDADRKYEAEFVASRDAMWGQVTTSALASFAIMQAAGGDVLNNLLVAAIDAVMGLIVTEGAAALVSQFKFLPAPLAIIAGGSIAAVVAGALAVARSELTRAREARHGDVDIDGPGTETSDSIPYRLSRRESVVTAEGTKAGDNADLFRFINRTGRNWRAFAALSEMEVPSMVGYIPPQPDLSRVGVSSTGEVVALTEMVAETQRQTQKLEEGFKRLEHEAKWKRREDREFREDMKKAAKKKGRGQQLNIFDALAQM